MTFSIIFFRVFTTLSQHLKTIPELSCSTNPIQQRVSSTIARQILDGQPVYVKQYSTGDWGRTADVVLRRTEREVDLVERLHASDLFSNRLGLVHIVSASPEEYSLTTAEVPGKTLDLLIASQFRNPDMECLSAMWLAGRWLRQFQQIELLESDRESISTLDPHDMVDYCRVRLEGLTKLGYRWPKGRMSGQILNQIEHLVENSNDSDKQLVWSHADFAPGNIIWDGRTLTPIDFGMTHADRPLLDVTYLIHRLEMQQIYRPWKSWPTEIWKRAILRGYGRPDADKSPMYQALMIRHLICRIHTYVRRQPRDLKQRLHDKWVRTVIRKKLERLTQESYKS